MPPRSSLHSRLKTAEWDLTSMIDVVFLLVAFFLLVINFTAADQNERIKLPVSETAQPPEMPPTEPMTLHILAEGNVVYNGTEYSLAELPKPVDRQIRLLQYMNVPKEKITVIIRADARTPSKTVLEVIEMCQSNGLTRFLLRTKIDETLPEKRPPENILPH
ncbi:MAG: biopolymer transporter ExbD [Planctomycetaceae bacterium]|jgi:biopolymer transport protein ExbD|nr:biopolymer transporter ExbD [Planctomycetaceae bacterium]